MKSFASLAALVAVAGLAGAQDRITVFVNGDPIAFQGVGPRQMDGRVLVPLRGVMEKLGAYVSYLPESKTVIASKGDIDLQLRLGQRLARLNGQEVFLDVPAQAYAGTTLVPLRFMSEALGAQVQWDAPAMAVRIVAPTQQTGPVTPPDTGAGQPIVRPFELSGFSMDRASGNLKPGDKVTFTLTGTRGGNAVMQIPGLTEQIRMAEVSPGRYQAVVTIPNSAMTINAANAIARFTYNGEERLIQAPNAITVDTQAPQILYPTPEPDSRVTSPQPNISFNFEDLNGSGIDRENVRVFLDGKDVTREATIGGSTAFFRPSSPLSSGAHKVRVEARDAAGNLTTREWTFNVALTRQVFEAVSHSGGRNLQPGQVVKLEVKGEPGGNVTFQIGEKVLDIPAREIAPGHYVGEYTVRLEDDLRGERVVARMRATDGEVYTLQAPQLLGEIRAPRQPAINEFGTTRSVGSTANFTGTAPRRARVHVTIEYTSTLLGLLGTRGKVYDQVVVADQTGKWETGDVKLDVVGTGSGTEYTVTARVLAANGVASEPVTYKFRR